MNVFDFDNSLRAKYGTNIIGVDECGRGSLAGPLCAGAVIFHPDTKINGIKDSKQLSPKDRLDLYDEITEQAIAWYVALIQPEEIDRIGINPANIKAMEVAANKTTEDSKLKINLYAVDQSPLKIKNMLMMPKFDSLSASVAAASIIAKVTHDKYMDELSITYPNYNLSDNKGYGNPEHIALIKKYGKIEGLHRMSFKIKALSNYTQVSL